MLEIYIVCSFLLICFCIKKFIFPLINSSILSYQNTVKTHLDNLNKQKAILEDKKNIIKLKMKTIDDEKKKIIMYGKNQIQELEHQIKRDVEIELLREKNNHSKIIENINRKFYEECYELLVTGLQKEAFHSLPKDETFSNIIIDKIDNKYH